MKIHLIAIGGSAMHNLAIALHLAGHQISGSDDEIFDPARYRLNEYGLLPEKIGWDESLITNDLDLIILGMHARKDNPELQKALSLGIKIYSYPEFVYEHSINKTRIVIGGSHGKTTITSMIMHVLKYHHVEFDYLVGAMIEGFDVMVRLSDAPLMVIEGDEYLSSCMDNKPKFLHYKPHIAVLTGISWDHINVFPVYREYVRQFELFIQSILKKGKLFYYSDDSEIQRIIQSNSHLCTAEPYQLAGYDCGFRFDRIVYNGNEYSLNIFGKHNMENLIAAWKVCTEIGISDEHFLQAMTGFKGASKRLQTYIDIPLLTVLFDFAHSPSKVKASCLAVRQRYPDKTLISILELHTFSSLNIEFIEQYRGTLTPADEVFIFYDKHTLEHKRLEPLDREKVALLFDHPKIRVIHLAEDLAFELNKMDWANKCFLFMSSGNYKNLDLKSIASEKHDFIEGEYCD